MRDMITVASKQAHSHVFQRFFFFFFCFFENNKHDAVKCTMGVNQEHTIRFA